jgi:hypothetical protein
LEEVLEEERKKLVGGTLVTLETFMEWKKKKIQEKQDKEQKVKDDLKQKAADRFYLFVCLFVFVLLLFLSFYYVIIIISVKVVWELD